MATNRATRYPGRWGAVSADYPMGVPKNRTSDTAKDGSYFEKDWIADYEAFFGSLLDEAGETVNGTTDTAQNSQLHKAMQKAREVSPLNNDWNGYLDPDHQSSLPAPNGYPGNSGGGEVAYTADEEISYGIYAGASGATVSSDDNGWVFTGSIYKLFTLTAEQLALIDVTTVPIFLKDQAGAAYFVNHNGTTVNVTKPSSTTLKVEITSGIFAELSITKLWRLFVTEKVGYVGELSADDVQYSLFGFIRGVISNVNYRIYRDRTIDMWGEGLATGNTPFTVNLPFSVDSSLLLGRITLGTRQNPGTISADYGITSVTSVTPSSFSGAQAKNDATGFSSNSFNWSIKGAVLL